MIRHPSTALIVMLCAASAKADWRAEIGHTRLLQLAASAGQGIPAATGSGVSHIEASTGVGIYGPDTASSVFSGKSFIFKSGASGVSSHANRVALNYYGSASLLSANSTVDLYDANSWIGGGFLNLGGGFTAPASEARAVQNHSWIGNGITESQATEIGRRLDFAINRDGFISVMGVNNGASTTLPQLLAQTYHGISVGRDDGQHSAGLTTLDGTGRGKPEIVAPSTSPDNATSWTTPMVAGAAGVLHGKLASAPYSQSGANLPRVVKALLLAGATKDTVPLWANTASRPLDARYGAGELNLHHSYLALLAGRATASNNTSYGIRGWAAETVNRSSSKTWYFTIPPGAAGTPFCAVLTWHRTVSSLGWTATLSNLDLRLHHASGFALGSQIAASASTVDNTELIHQPALPPGNYALVVENTSSNNTAIGMAWHSLPAVTTAASSPLAREIDGQQGTLTLSRTGDSTFPLWVPLAISGSAVPGTHYQPLPSAVMIPAGQSSVSLQVIPIADFLAQSNRTVIVAAAQDFASVRDFSQTAVVTIEDKPFDAWRFENFSGSELADAATSGDAADPDGDGLANLVEYALDFEPNKADARPASVSEIDDYLTISHTKNPAATDITWAAEVTGNFTNWQAALILTDTSTAFTARDTVLISNSERRFLQLKISRP